MLHIGRRGLLQRNVRLYKSLAGCHGYKPKETKKEPLPAKDTCAVASFFQRNGYKYANINPLVDPSSKTLPEVLGKEYAEVNDLEHLKSSYCGSIAFEVDHLDSCEERCWFYEKAEEHYETPAERKKEFLKLLIQSQTFDEFLGIKHPTLKRYSGEGCESMMVLFDELIKLSSIENVEDIILSIPHRGRSNLLVGLLQYPPSQLFHKIKGNAEFSEKYRFIGDVISHLTSSVTIEPSTTDGHPVHVSMVPNPSHLESSHPVAMGKSRARLLTKGYGDYSSGGTENKVVCVQVHGDAAISAQGIVMESLSLAQVPHFDIGGSIHLVVNNQIGFTTPQDRASSMDHCTDIMKMIDCPIIHVNGDYPEEVAKATRIAFDYKNKFLKDVIINMHCFRYHGHNEIDEPSFTNPAMYNLIRSRPSVPNLYKSKLIEQAVTTENEVAEMHSTHKAMLNEAFTLSNQPTTVWQPFLGNWEDVEQASNQSTSTWHTGFDLGKLRMIGEKSAELPDNFFVHKQLLKSFCTARVNKVKEGSAIDWATAEALAVGSLLLEGNNVRMCGQDVGRGTFNHRHFMLVDQDTEEMHIPLNHINPQQKALLEVVNSPLSEEAVLGYEYGVSVESPNHLVLWEAQFGDFFNGAQIIIDTFISSGETKWLLQSGLVMLLPHGMDGAGPDHSSCKIERFLQLSDSSEDKVDSDDVNMQIVNPTTPAQYFHLIRRQQVRNFRKPLIVASPKLILRSPLATSPLSDLQEGTYFKPVLDDPESAVGADVVVFCSGKHFYALKTHREKLNKNNVAIVRLESLVPFPAEEIKDILKKYTNAQQFIWSQEEHRNQGAWSFINPRFTNLLNVNLSYRGRDVLGASAVGIGKRHVEEIQRLFDSVF